MNIAKGKIGNALTSTAANHVVAVTKDLYDEVLEQYQEEINQELKTKGETNKSAIDNLLLQHQNDVADLNKIISDNKTVLDNLSIEHQNDVADLNKSISDNKSALDDLSVQHQSDVAAINKTISDNKKSADDKFMSLDTEQTEQDNRIDNNEQEIEDLKILVAAQQKLIEQQQAIIDEQQEKLDALTGNFTLIDLGRWENAMIWENDAYWSNLPMAQQISNGISVIEYNAETQTIIL